MKKCCAVALLLASAWQIHAEEWVSRTDKEGNPYSERIVRIVSVSAIDPDELDYDKSDELFPSRYHVQLDVSTDGAGNDSETCPDSQFVFIADEAVRPRRGKMAVMNERFIVGSAERDAMFTLATVAIVHKARVRVAVTPAMRSKNRVLADFPSELRGSSGHQDLCRLIGIQVLGDEPEEEPSSDSE